MSTEQSLIMGHPYASNVTMNNAQIMDVVETASNFHQLMSPRFDKSVWVF